MSLSNNLIYKFVETTVEERETSKETIVYGTTVELDGIMWVKIDGSELFTPVSTVTSTKPGERVTVLIKDHSAVITGNISSPSASHADVEELGEEITEFGHAIAHKVTAEELEVGYAMIDTLLTKVAAFENVEAVVADIENLRADYASLDYISAKDINALSAKIDSIQAKFGEFTGISADQLEALNADITNLRAYNANFTYLSVEQLNAVNAEIEKLQTDKLDAESAKILYADIDFSNIKEAAIRNIFGETGLIKDLTVGSQTLTGELVGVTLSGDLIKANTLKADKLVVKGSDGLYYKLNIDAGAVASAEVSKEDLQSGLHGTAIIAKTITAEKISVSDLVAFGATIGGYHITNNALYSGVKNSVNNTTSGVYLDAEGQMAIGDASNFIKYYKDTDGKFKLAISANSIVFGASNKTADDVLKASDDAVKAVQDLEKRADSGEFAGEDATVLRIDSSRGTVFKNNQVSTVLSAVIYKGSKRITSITELKKEYGESAHLQWQWQKMDETTFGTIVSTDSRIGQNGFTFTLSPSDVSTKITFMCQLITD